MGNASFAGVDTLTNSWLAVIEQTELRSFAESMTRVPMARNELADFAVTIEPNPDTGQRTVLVLLDLDWVTSDLERIVGQFIGAFDGGERPAILVLCEKPLAQSVAWLSWQTLVVPDIARIAVAYGAPTLPWGLVTGSLVETRKRIDAIANQRLDSPTSRGSGAISADELH